MRFTSRAHILITSLDRKEKLNNVGPNVPSQFVHLSEIDVEYHRCTIVQKSISTGSVAMCLMFGMHRRCVDTHCVAEKECSQVYIVFSDCSHSVPLDRFNMPQSRAC